ncbi:hypothetical protein Bbelb_418270 [Branchiostoma belcheri]|nr:hypothetical protein Bbelb_418270 [Branchiostoma belcheri]
MDHRRRRRDAKNEKVRRWIASIPADVDFDFIPMQDMGRIDWRHSNSLPRRPHSLARASMLSARTDKTESTASGYHSAMESLDESGRLRRERLGTAGYLKSIEDEGEDDPVPHPQQERPTRTERPTLPEQQPNKRRHDDGERLRLERLIYAGYTTPSQQTRSVAAEKEKKATLPKSESHQMRMDRLSIAGYAPREPKVNPADPGTDSAAETGYTTAVESPDDDSPIASDSTTLERPEVHIVQPISIDVDNIEREKETLTTNDDIVVNDIALD